MTFKFGGSGGGGGGISSIDATASGAIGSGKPAFLKGDGKIAEATGTGSTHTLVDSDVCITYNNSHPYSFYSSRTIVDRPAGRLHRWCMPWSPAGARHSGCPGSGRR